MQKVTIVVFAFFIIILVFIPLLYAIENGFNSTESFYGKNI